MNDKQLSNKWDVWLAILRKATTFIAKFLFQLCSIRSNSQTFFIVRFNGHSP